MFDQGRIIYKLVKRGTYEDREVYVIARSLGAFINIIMQPDNPRTAYPSMVF